MTNDEISTALTGIAVKLENIEAAFKKVYNILNSERTTNAPLAPDDCWRIEARIAELHAENYDANEQMTYMLAIDRNRKQIQKDIAMRSLSIAALQAKLKA